MIPLPRRDLPLLLGGIGLIASSRGARAAEDCTGTVFTADEGAASISAKVESPAMLIWSSGSIWTATRSGIPYLRSP